MELNLPSLLVVTRLFASYSWGIIKQELENHLRSKAMINPFSDDKALIKLDVLSAHSLNLGLWYQYGDLILKVEEWSASKHSTSDVTKGFGGWIVIKNLPIQYWKREVFETIGEYMGGLVCISSQTLNLTDLTHALIQVERNICGFLPASIPFSDGDQLQIALAVEPRYHSSFAPAIPPIVLLEDFANSLDRNRVKEALLHKNLSPENPLGRACQPARELNAGSVKVMPDSSPPCGSLPKVISQELIVSSAQPNPINKNLLSAPQFPPLSSHGPHILNTSRSTLIQFGPGPQPKNPSPSNPSVTPHSSPNNLKLPFPLPSSKPIPFPKVYSRRKKNTKQPIPEDEAITNRLVPQPSESQVNPIPIHLAGKKCSFSVIPFPGKRLNFDLDHVAPPSSISQIHGSPASDSSLSLSSEDSDFSSANSTPQKFTSQPIQSPNLAEFFDLHSEMNHHKNTMEIGIPCPEGIIPDHLSSLIERCGLKLKLLSPISA